MLPRRDGVNEPPTGSQRLSQSARGQANDLDEYGPVGLPRTRHKRGVNPPYEPPNPRHAPTHEADGAGHGPAQENKAHDQRQPRRADGAVMHDGDGPVLNAAAPVSEPNGAGTVHVP